MLRTVTCRDLQATTSTVCLFGVLFFSLNFGAGLTTLQVASFAPIGAATGFAIYGGYAWLFSTCGAGALYRRFARVVKAAFGLAFGAFGLMLLASGLRSLRP